MRLGASVEDFIVSGFQGFRGTIGSGIFGLWPASMKVPA